MKRVLYIAGQCLATSPPLSVSLLLSNLQDFYNVVQLKAVISACEAFYAGVFCGGNVAQARGLMLPQKTDERVDLAQFQVSTVHI